MKVTINDRVTMAEITNLPFKRNILRLSPIPEIIDASGKPFTAKSGKIVEITGVGGDRAMCDRRHVQLHGELPFTVTYAVESDSPINKLLVGTYTDSTDYGYGRYEVYLGNDKDTLYSKENFIAEYDRREIFDPKDILKGTAQIFILDTPVLTKFFGIKFTHGCILDTVVRLDFAGVFSTEAEAEQLSLDGYGVDLMEKSTITSRDDILTYDLGFATQIDTLILKSADHPVKTSVNGKVFIVNRLDCTPKKIGNTDAFCYDGGLYARYIRTQKGNLIGAFSKKDI